MSKFSEYIGSQFGNPRGLIGKICCMIMNMINAPMYKKVISLADVKKGDKILDIGYGNGFLLKKLDNCFSPELYGIDISEDMKIQAEKRNKRAKTENRLHLSLGDCCNLPYSNDFFDAVTSVNTVYFWNDTVKGLREINRCLKNGGEFYNVVYSKEWLDKLSYTEKGFKKYSPQDLAALAEQSGFVDVQVREIKKGKSFIVIYKKSL